MRDIKNAFQRTGEISREVSKRSDWLEDFAEEMFLRDSKAQAIQKQASRSTTAVEVARQRQQAQPSIYEMMSAIVSGKQPKFSSVEEAVKHYQESTGLAQYLKAQKEDKMSAYADLINTAGDGDHIPLQPHETAQLPADPNDAALGSAQTPATPVGPATTDATPVGPATNQADQLSADDEDENDLDPIPDPPASPVGPAQTPATPVGPATPAGGEKAVQAMTLDDVFRQFRTGDVKKKV